MAKTRRESKSRKDIERAQRVSRLLDPLLERLGLGQQYTFYISFHNRLLSDSVVFGGRRKVNVQARVDIDEYFPYRAIHIEMLKQLADKGTDRQIVSTIIHEILHIIPFFDLSKYVGALLGYPAAKDYRWSCLEEETVELLALWIADLWLMPREKAERPAQEGTGR